LPKITDTEDVTGSNPVSPTSKFPSQELFPAAGARLVPAMCPLRVPILPQPGMRRHAPLQARSSGWLSSEGPTAACRAVRKVIHAYQL
jgi:hypothetical protein